MAERYWQNWDEGEAAQSIDFYWVDNKFEANWRKLLVSDIQAEFGKKAPILEVGCGSGLIYEEMLRHRVVTTKSYLGGDISQNMLALARQRFPTAKFADLDIFNMPFPDKSQPNVICIHVLQHLPHYAEAMKELARITNRKLYMTSWFNQTGEDNIVWEDTPWGSPFYNNRYSLPKFLTFIYDNFCADVKSLCVKHLVGPSYSVSLTFQESEKLW